MARGMKSSPNMCSAYDHVFSSIAIVVVCVVVNNAHCPTSKRVELIMIMFVKVQKLFLVIRISTHHLM
jgi:hypothetical protein